MRFHRASVAWATRTLVLVVATLSSSSMAQETTTVLTGEIVDDGAAYFVIPFTVLADTVEIEIAHDDLSTTNILDWGVWSPDGFRGWGGGNEENAVIGVNAASRSYLPGPLAAGEWEVVVGIAKRVSSPLEYHVEITQRTTETFVDDAVRTAYAPQIVDAAARFYAGDFHVHSRESGDANATLDEIGAYAASVGIDFVVVTDHNTESHVALLNDAQSRRDDVLFIPGAEFTTYGGHVGAYGVTTYVDHRIGLDGRTIDDALSTFDDDAVLAINHPMLDLGDACIGCAWAYDDDGLDDVHAVEIMTGGSVLFLDQSLAFWDSKLDRGFTLVAVGGSDDHRAGTGTGFAQSPIGTPTTMVYATELSERAVLDGVRSGLTVVMLDGANGTMVEFAMDPPRTSSTIEFTPGDNVELSARIIRGNGRDVTLVKDGFPVDGETHTVSGDDVTLTFTVTPSDGTRFRVEVREGDTVKSVTSHVVFQERLIVDDIVDGCACDTVVRAAAFDAADDKLSAALFLSGLGVAFAALRGMDVIFAALRGMDVMVAALRGINVMNAALRRRRRSANARSRKTRY